MPENARGSTGNGKVSTAGRVPDRPPRDVVIDLHIRRKAIDIADGCASAITFNNSLPGPLVELPARHRRCRRLHLHPWIQLRSAAVRFAVESKAGKIMDPDIVAPPGAARTSYSGAPTGWENFIKGSPRYTFTIFDRLEYGASGDGDSYLWDMQGWLGGDFNKSWWNTEGEGRTSGDPEGAEFQALYNHTIAPFLCLQTGVRYDTRPGPDTVYGVLGLQGLAPYWFETDLSLFVSEDGHLSFRGEFEYELLLTQRLILQPRLELNPSTSMSGNSDSTAVSTIVKAVCGCVESMHVFARFFHQPRGRKIIMKTQITTAVLIIGLAFAHSIELQAQDTGTHAQHHPGAPSGQADMGDQRSMQQHMRDMQETMQRIQDATDPAERRELMAQHRQQMHEAMGSMCSMMDDKGMMSGKGMMGGDGSHAGMEDMNPEMRRKMMQEHMRMMKGMMDQMQMHMEADKPMQQSQ